MSGHLITIVVPNYNYADYLPRAVMSAAEQTYEQKELIVVDDCSKDASVAVLHKLKDQYEGCFPGGFRIEQSPRNMGAHAAINRGFELAQGKYAAILNADDMFERSRLAVMEGAMRASEARLAFSSVQCIDADDAPIGGGFAEKMRSLPESVRDFAFAALAAVAENIAVSTGNMMMEVSLHEELGGFKSYRYVHDYDFLLRAALLDEPVYVPETDYLYRLHGDNSFTRLQEIGIAENRLVWLEMYAAVKRGDVHNPEILRRDGYMKMFRDAASRYGFQKKVMWALAGTPAGAAAAALMRRKLRTFDAKHAH